MCVFFSLEILHAGEVKGLIDIIINNNEGIYHAQTPVRRDCSKRKEEEED